MSLTNASNLINVVIVSVGGGGSGNHWCHLREKVKLITSFEVKAILKGREKSEDLRSKGNN